MERLEAGRITLSRSKYPVSALIEAGANLNPDRPAKTGLEALSLPEVDFSVLTGLDPSLQEIDPRIGEQIKREATYSAYLDRQERDAQTIAKDEARRLPHDLDYGTIPGLSSELRSKLERHRPASVGEAARIEGMTAAGLLLLINTSRRIAA